MSGIIRPKKSYEEQRREFNMKRGLPHPTDPVLRDEPASPPAPEPAAHPVEKHRQPAADRKPRQARSPRAPRTKAESTAAVLVKLRVPAPKPGTFPLFDKAVASMDEKRALQRLLSKSLSELTLAVERGERSRLPPIPPARPVSTRPRC